ncbi:four helix bundle protein [Verrucomicrobiaceae bacterium 5K15]|uniref:Four helix bundle protein n=1 Tax=Oceaniferula flava TaxID=2800421 RepID=A0AAE2VEQ1_9BACT|nr:four helix bundle protein [Oceaniferula flavus]MBK1856109.1 four helix bundle protein [Oceaniferula flavus]MBM1137416.1 four helix bundle protein [Oceaniferula flavus]
MPDSINNLEVYREAMTIGETVWSLVAQWDHFSKNAVGLQFVRSAGSIAANISEGHGRYHYKENIKFCHYSRGSLTETQTWIEKSVHRNLIPKEQGRELYQQLEILHKRLNAYITSIRKSATND